MNKHIFRRTAKWWNDWAEQSVKLIRDCLPENPTTIDANESRLRSYYILLSYAFELMLKSRLIAVKKDVDENQLITKYKHDIGEILKTLKSLNELKNIGIDSFLKDTQEHTYIIKTIQKKEFIIHDFTNIRYYPVIDN